MSIYTITVKACDDSITIQADLTGAGAAAVAKVARAITASSSWSGQPVMYIATGAHEFADETGDDL
ncbi:hypothetical protein LCL87_24960 [Rhodococcus hoagii]|nr:hypothetical protein [Prescottella equi]